MDGDLTAPVDGSAGASAPEPSAPQSRTSTSKRRPRRRRQSRALVAVLAAAAAAGGAFAGCHPTGTPVVDPLYTALLAALVTVAASRASRSSLLIFAAVGAGLCRGWLLAPGAAALLIAFGAALPRRARRRVGALVGALGIQVVLRWPAIGFHGLTALIAAVAVAVCLISALTRVGPRYRRWVLRATLGVAGLVVVCSAPVAVGALLARPAISGGISATEDALTTASGGATRAGVQDLTVAATDFSVASDRAGSWWTSEGLLVPVVAQQRRAIAGATGTGRTVTLTAAREASAVDVNDLGYRGGHFDLARIRSLAAPIDQLDSSLGAAQARLAGIRSSWLVEPVQTRLANLAAKLAKARASATTAAMAVRAAPGILGGSGDRHYLIAFMTPAESRGLDGFIGAYGELNVDNGRITLTRAGSVARLNDVPAGKRRITGPADYLARYAKFHPADHFQDLSYSPDFPTVAQVIAQMYPQSGGDHIDGVIALDPDGLASLLKITGPVTVPGLATPLTSANAASFLLKGEYDEFGNANAARHDFLQEALSVAFHRLVTSALPAPQTVAGDLDPAVRQGRILFWTANAADQPLLRRVGLAGAFPVTPGRDVLAVTTQNVANSKIDAYLHRGLDDEVRFDPATGLTRSTLTVTLHNAAPARGLPSYVLGSYAGSGIPEGTNRTWLSVYSPLMFTGGTEDGAVLDMSSEPELGINTYSTYINVPAGGTVTLKLHLSGTLARGAVYQLTVRGQPMVVPDQLTTSFAAVGPWARSASTGAPWQPAIRQQQTETVRFRKTS